MIDRVIEVSGLSYGTPAGRVLQRELTFTLRSGQMLLITGSNGCGKSTLLKTLLQQTETMAGWIRCSIPEDKVEYIPQLENTEVHFPLTLHDVLELSSGLRDARERVLEYGLLRDEQLDSAWNTASGGERKRTLLTRALLRDPWMLVFDEPMNHLDAASRRGMLRVMADFLASSETEPRAIVMVCHQGLESAERKVFDILNLNLDLNNTMADYA